MAGYVEYWTHIIWRECIHQHLIEQEGHDSIALLLERVRLVSRELHEDGDMRNQLLRSGLFKALEDVLHMARHRQ